MKRPIVVAVIGYLIGIIFGLYFRISIALLYLSLALITVSIKVIAIIYKTIKLKMNNSLKESTYQLIKDKAYKKNLKKKFSFYSISRHLRYLKLIINKKVLITIIIISCISNVIVVEKNKKYETIYNMPTNVEILAKVINNGEEKEYKNTYKIKTIEINKSKQDIDLILDANKKQKLEYGDIIKISGEYKSPSDSRNYGGFSYKDYLKTQNIYGAVTAKNISIIEKTNKNHIGFLINSIKEKVKINAKKYLDDETYSIFLGLILGDTSFIEEETIEAFRNSNMSHILAVSGMHITYIVIGIVMFLTKVAGKKIAKILSIVLLLFYITITGFSPSIIRACSTAIIMLVGSIINRKADVWTSMSISVFIILVYNPFLITSIGFQFSYMGTIGILLFTKNILKLLTLKKHRIKYKTRKIDIIKRKIKEKPIVKYIHNQRDKLKYKKLKNKRDLNEQPKLKELIAVSISAQIFIIPLTIYHFNTIGIYFIITNILLSLIIGPVMIIGFISLIMIFLNTFLASIIAIPLKLGINFILLITNVGNLPFSKIYLKSPNITELIIYYLIIIFLNFMYSNFSATPPTNTNLRVQYMYHITKYNYRKYKKKVLAILLITSITITSLIFFIQHNLKIHFVDVGQGDCCFIETPSNKTILIDGGGSEFGTFDVGKSTLLPYILDRGYTKIDYMFISHFDSDHVQGLLTILKELQVQNVIITKQKEESKNYKDFIEIANSKKIKVKIVKKGDRVKIENNLCFDIIWPDNQNLVNENALNNNSMVCKLNYKNFIMLFTGDIEEIAEKQILQEYRNSKILNSTVLKVGHHGSKTSTTQEFLEVIKPKIALIGVGENNKFGHPNQEIIQRLQTFRHPNIQNRPKRRNNIRNKRKRKYKNKENMQLKIVAKIRKE